MYRGINFISELRGEASLVPVVQVHEHEEDQEAGADDTVHPEHHHRAWNKIDNSLVHLIIQVVMTGT